MVFLCIVPLCTAMRKVVLVHRKITSRSVDFVVVERVVLANAWAPFKNNICKVGFVKSVSSFSRCVWISHFSFA